MTGPTRDQVEAICKDLDDHTQDERGHCAVCMLRWPCYAVEIREALRALVAERDALREELVGASRCGAFGIVSGSECIRENDHDGEHVTEVELAALREDGARLEWLAGHHGRIAYWDNTDDGDVYRPCGSDDRPVGPPMPLRAAVDAARQGGA